VDPDIHISDINHTRATEHQTTSYSTVTLMICYSENASKVENCPLFAL